METSENIKSENKTLSFKKNRQQMEWMKCYVFVKIHYQTPINVP